MPTGGTRAGAGWPFPDPDGRSLSAATAGSSRSPSRPSTGSAAASVFALAAAAGALSACSTALTFSPQLRILARATSRQHAYELLRHGVQDIYRETFGSAVDLSVDALVALGLPRHRAERAAQLFRQHEDASVREMAQLDTEDVKGYVSMARLHIANLENALASDKEVFQRSAGQRTEEDQRSEVGRVES